MPRRIIIVLSLIALIVACKPVIPVSNDSATVIPEPAATGKPLTPLVTATPTPPGALQINVQSLRGAQITVWHAWVGAAADLFQSQVDAFNQTNEWGITVKSVALPNQVDLFTQIITVISKPDQPDVIIALPEQLAVMDAALVDVNAYALDPTLGLDIADFPAAFWPADQTTRRVEVPAARSARFLFYNVTWARELGFTAPPATSDEFEQQACAANASFKRDTDQQNDGYGGWVVDPAWDSTYAWMRAFGGGLIDNKLASDENAKALTYLKTLYDNNCAWIVQSDSSPFDAFAARKALFIGGSLPEIQDALRAMRLAGNNDAWTVIPFPGTEQRQVVVTYGSSYAILQSDEKRQTAAWLFVRWMLERDNQIRWVQTLQLFPLRASVLASVNESRSASPQWTAAAALIARAEPAPRTNQWRVAKLVLGDAVNGIFLHDVSVDIMPDVLHSMDAMVEELEK